MTFNMRTSFALLALATALLAVGCGKKTSAQAHEATLDELNRDLSVMILHSGGALPGTNEFNQFLAATHKTFPTPPPGKVIVLDPAAKHFVLQDK